MRKVQRPKWEKRNIFKEVLTSLVGFALIGLGGLLIYKGIEAQGWEHMTMLISEGLGLGATGLYMLGIKDPRLPGGGRSAVTVIILVTLSSCVTWDKCSQKFAVQINAKKPITLRDTIAHESKVKPPADSLTNDVPEADSLDEDDTVYHASESGEIEIMFWKERSDSLEQALGKKSKLRYKAKCDPDTVKTTEYIPVEIQGECPEVTVLDPEKGAPLWHRWLNGYKNFSAWALLLLIIVIIFKRQHNG